MNISATIENVKQKSKENKQWFVPVGLALLGSLLLLKGIKDYKEKIGLNMEMAQILVAGREMGDGHVLTEKDFRTQNIPTKYLPVGVLFTSDARKATGHVVTRPIAKGEMVIWSSIDVGFTPAGPARRIAKGYRAISVPVDAASSISNSIIAGDHVDLVSTVTIPGENIPTTLTLLQNVSVLDVGSPVKDENSATYSTVSLMVLPKEVGIIVHAQQNGKMTMVLRNPEDNKTPQNLPMVAMPQLVESAFRNSLQQERNDSVEVIKGGKLSFDH